MERQDRVESSSTGIINFYIGVMRQMAAKLEEAALAGIELENQNRDSRHEVEELQQQSRHDNLTGAPNLLGLQERLKELGDPKAVLYIDPTNFKAVNDRWGHEVGDEAIKTVYLCLLGSVRNSDIVARIYDTGDEFLIALYGDKPGFDRRQESRGTGPDRRRGDDDPLSHAAEVRDNVAERVQKIRNENPDLVEINFDISVGLAIWGENRDINEIIREAEVDMYTHKKEQHKNGQHRAA